MLGGFRGRRIDGEHLIELRHPENAFDHAVNSGEMQSSAGFLEAAEAFHDLADDGAVHVVDGGHIEDDAVFIFLDVAFDFAIEQGAIVAHGDAPGNFEKHDTGLDWSRG